MWKSTIFDDFNGISKKLTNKKGSKIIFFDHIFPFDDFPRIENIKPHFFNVFDHLDFGLQLASASHHLSNAFRWREQM